MAENEPSSVPEGGKPGDAWGAQPTPYPAPPPGPTPYPAAQPAASPPPQSPAPSPPPQSPAPYPPPQSPAPYPPAQYAPGPVPGGPGAPGAPGGMLARPDFRPGIIALRPLTIGDIYPGVIAAIRGNPAATLGLAALISLVVLVPFTALSVWGAPAIFEQVTTNSTAQEALDIGIALPALVTGLGTIVAQVFLIGLMSYVVAQGVQGLKVTPGQTWKAVLGAFWRIVGTLILTLLALLGAAVLAFVMIFLIIGAVLGVSDSADVGFFAVLVFLLLAAGMLMFFLWFSTRFTFAPAIALLESTSATAAMARSWRLTSGRPVWRIIGIRFLTMLAVGVVTQVVGFGVGVLFGAALPSSPTGAFFAIAALMAGVTTLLTIIISVPFSSGVDALLYIDQRIRREGLDVQLMQAASARVSSDPV